VLPNPKTRVTLSEANGDPTSTYINANYIKSVNGAPGKYIACQGPKPETVLHFWRMIWETNCRAIIMVTGLVEAGRDKCARYWPNVRYNTELQCGDVQIGDINVAVIGGYRKNTYITSNLKVRKGGEERLIKHFWFDTWPDHGVPQHTPPVVAMLHDVRAWSDSVDQPWVVHCSAGIGRTGTFIAIDQGLHELQQRRRTDVLGLIKSMRSQRGGMVQHVEQAEFVHNCLVNEAHELQAEAQAAADAAPSPGSTASTAVLESSLLRAEYLVPTGFQRHASQVDTDEGAEGRIPTWREQQLEQTRFKQKEAKRQLQAGNPAHRRAQREAVKDAQREARKSLFDDLVAPPKQRLTHL